MKKEKKLVVKAIKKVSFIKKGTCSNNPKKVVFGN